MAERTAAERIKELQILCDQLDVLREQAEELCKSATAEIRRTRIASQRDRRVKTKKVKRERRQREG